MRSSPEARQTGRRPRLATRAYDVLKRAIDLALAAVALVVLAPVMAGVALVVRRDLGRPILFRQVRTGRSGRPFTILKFRTMEMRDARCCLDPAACRGLQMPPETTMTPRAAKLRRTGLDELPQIINILRGEMSFVGPRPLLPRYVPRYTTEQRRRHEVRPGITGWAQVNGRTDLDWDARLALDVWYVDHRSLIVDARILAATIRTTSSGAGFSQSGSDTGLEFLGTGVPAGTCPATELPLAQAALFGRGGEHPVA